MRYKGQFHGSELLCSVSHSFVRLEDVKEKLARHESCLVEDAAEARRLRRSESDLWRVWSRCRLWLYRTSLC